MHKEDTRTSSSPVGFCVDSAVIWMRPTSTEKYAEVPEGVVPCSPGARYVPLVSICERAEEALLVLFTSGLP